MRNPNFPQSTDLPEGVLQQRPPTAAVRRGEDGTQQRPAEPSAATAAHPTSSWSIAAAAPTNSAGRSEEGGRERLREDAGGSAGDERVEREEEADGTGDRGSGGA